MTREIKFRGIRRDNGEFVYGYYFHLPYMDDHAIRTADDDFAVDPETVGQYTGLKDRNGVEIYEGDILFNKRGYSGNERLLCRWQDAIDDGNWTTEKPGFRFDRINGTGTTIWVANKDIEVIGNQFEHSHLLEQ